MTNVPVTTVDQVDMAQATRRASKDVTHAFENGPLESTKRETKNEGRKGRIHLFAPRNDTRPPVYDVDGYVQTTPHPRHVFATDNEEHDLNDHPVELLHVLFMGLGSRKKPRSSRTFG